MWPDEKLNMQLCMDWNGETGPRPSESNGGDSGKQMVVVWCCDDIATKMGNFEKSKSAQSVRENAARHCVRTVQGAYGAGHQWR